MKSNIVQICVLAGFGLLASVSQAESLVNGNPEAGKTKSVTCSACHGTEGNSMSPAWPNLAGQAASYTVTQLKAFKPDAEGKALRSDPLMTAQAMLLSEQDMNDLAVYFETLPKASQAVANSELIATGEALWRGGNAKKGVAACMACHGPDGRGNPAAAYPLLAGQHATYTSKQLNDYASGARQSDGKTRIMRDIAERLSPDEIKALASYIQGLK